MFQSDLITEDIYYCIRSKCTCYGDKAIPALLLHSIIPFRFVLLYLTFVFVLYNPEILFLSQPYHATLCRIDYIYAC